MAHAAEVELADVTSSKVGDAEAQIHRKVEELNQELRSGERQQKAETALCSAVLRQRRVR